MANYVNYTCQMSPAPTAQGDDPSPPLADALARLTFIVQLDLTEVAAGRGLSLTQLRLLGVLEDRVLAMADLARHLRLDRSSITGLVARAEKRGLVCRELRPEDGRGVQVRITAEGLHLAGELRTVVTDRIQRLTDSLSAAEKAALTSIVKRLVAPRDKD